eukprot:gb/GEZN01006993.1/.p1 GENE.gb/GEZN01006993.1/~~gb/GEZN01006993.1/.p1  ORF type:complete len:334 (+),score=51.25 gb/GEZN01006993.1/:130-1002(+)
MSGPSSLSGKFSLPAKSLRFGGQAPDGKNYSMSFNFAGCLSSEQPDRTQLSVSLFLNTARQQLMFFYCNAGKLCAESEEQDLLCSLSLDSLLLTDCGRGLLTIPDNVLLINKLSTGELAGIGIAATSCFFFIMCIGSRIRDTEIRARVLRHNKLSEAIGTFHHEDLPPYVQQQLQQEHIQMQDRDEEEEEQEEAEEDGQEDGEPRFGGAAVVVPADPKPPTGPPPDHLVGRRTSLTTLTPRNKITPQPGPEVGQPTSEKKTEGEGKNKSSWFSFDEETEAGPTRNDFSTR